MALLPAAGSVFEIKDAEVVFLHILFYAPHGPGALRDDEGVAGLHQRLSALRVFNLGGAFGNDAPFPEKSVLCPSLLQFFERCSFNLNLETLFPNPKSLSSLLFFFS